MDWTVDEDRVYTIESSRTATKNGLWSKIVLSTTYSKRFKQSGHFSPAESNMRVLLKAELNRKWCDVTQNSPQLWSSLPWAVMTAYSSTWKQTRSCWDADSDRKLFKWSASRVLPSWLMLGRGIWLAGISCCSFCQRFLHWTVTSLWRGGAAPRHYLWHHMWIYSEWEHGDYLTNCQ